MDVTKYEILPIEPGQTPVKSSCRGIGQRKCLATSVILVIAIILALYTLFRIRNGSSVEFKDILTTYTRHDYNKAKHRIPQCIVIGMRKGGTRALLSFLSVHPDIQASEKEIHYFNRDDNFFQGINWYKKNLPMSYGDQITIEKTPAYFHSKEAPQRVFGMNSTIKLILIVRDPIQRAMSDHLQLMTKRRMNGLETYDFEEKVIKNGRINEDYKPLQRSVYHKYMEHWLKYFSLDQILIIDAEKLTVNPYEVVQTVETYLGLSYKITKDIFVYDRTKGFYCIKNETTGHKCLSQTKGRKHPVIDENIEDQLKEFFSPHNQIFFEQIGHTFDW